MTTSPTSFLSEIVSGDVIPVGKLEYFRSRLSNKLHELIIDEFARLSETTGFTKAELARRIQKEPAQITRWLGTPSNWTLDTLSDLAVGMGCEPNVVLVQLRMEIEAKVDASASAPSLAANVYAFPVRPNPPTSALDAATPADHYEPFDVLSNTRKQKLSAHSGYSK